MAKCGVLFLRTAHAPYHYLMGRLWGCFHYWMCYIDCCSQDNWCGDKPTSDNIKNRANDFWNFKSNSENISILQMAVTPMVPRFWDQTRSGCGEQYQLISTITLREFVDWFRLTNAKPVATHGIGSTIQKDQVHRTNARDVHAWNSICEAIGKCAMASNYIVPRTQCLQLDFIQFIQNLGPAHWEGVKRLITYLGSTRIYG